MGYTIVHINTYNMMSTYSTLYTGGGRELADQPRRSLFTLKIICYMEWIKINMISLLKHD